MHSKFDDHTVVWLQFQVFLDVTSQITFILIPPLVRALSHINPVHTFDPHCLIYLHIFAVTISAEFFDQRFFDAFLIHLIPLDVVTLLTFREDQEVKEAKLLLWCLSCRYIT
jgi:hypothetical protein